jgi:hypothetical protein
VAREMRGGGCVRILLLAAVLLATASCVSQNNWSPLPLWSAPVHMALSNYRFDHVAIEAVVSAAPDCSPADPNVPPIDFDLPFKGTRVIEATPSGDVCWRRKTETGQWTEWSRASTALGRSVDVQL